MSDQAEVIIYPDEKTSGYMWEPTERQLLVASYLGQGMTWDNIIRRVGVSRYTIYHWGLNPNFKALVDEFRARILGHYEEKYIKVTELALGVLEEALSGNKQPPEVLRLARERVKVLDKIALIRAQNAYAEEETL